MLRNLALGQQGVHRHDPPFQHQMAQQVHGYRDLVGLVIHCLLGQGQAHAVRQRREEMGARSALLLTAP